MGMFGGLGNMVDSIFGGGGGGGQTTSTTNTSNIPGYAQPYVENMLGATQNQLFNVDESGNITGFKPYQAYGATIDQNETYVDPSNGVTYRNPNYGKQIGYDPSKAVAGFQPMQTAAQQGIQNLQVPGAMGQASDATSGIMGALGNLNYGGQQFGNQYQGIAGYNPGQYNQQNVEGAQAQAAQTGYQPNLNMYQMGGPRDVRTQQFTGNQVGQYMNPYLQQALDPQLKELERQYGISGTQQQGAATQAGAFGGSREAIMAAENERNKNMAMTNLIGQGYNQAYQNAQQQFNAQQAANLQAQQANQQAGLTTGQANLNAALGVQGLGAQYGSQMALANLGNQQQANLQNAQLAQQANLANQQTNLATQQAQQQANQFGYGQAVNQAQLAAQYGLGANQLNAQQQQFGANYGLQALQSQLAAANQLGSQGQQQLAAQQGILGLQNQVGAQQQALEQQKINQAMQDYANAQQYPLMQLGTMSNMLRGLPMQASTTNQYAAAPSALNQGIGAAGTYAALSNSKAFGASGGLPSEFKMKKMASGGITSIPRYDVGGEVYADLEKMSLDELQDEAKNSSSQRVKQMAQNLLRQKQVVSKAGGGIIAFAKGTEKTVEKDAEDQAAASLAEETPGQGIVAAAPKGSKFMGVSNDLAGLEKSLMTERSQYLKEASQDPEALAKKLEAQAGPNVGRQNLMQEEMARRANNADEAERNRQLRLAEFFASWGSTPGSVLVAGMSAFKKSVPGMIEDQKEARRIQRESDKIIYELNEADRLEKNGFRDKSKAIIDKAASMAQQINETVAKIKTQQEHNAVVSENTKAQLAATAESKRQHNEGAKYRDLATAKENLVHVQNVINNETKQGVYKNAYDLATPYEGKDLSNLDETTRNMVQKARDTVAAADKRHQTMLRNAESDVTELYKRANPMGTRGEAATTAAAPAVELPEGIPAGSKQVGTSGGKPVFEDAKGKRYIVG